MVAAAHGRPVTLAVFTIVGGKIAAIEIIDNPDRIAGAGLTMLAVLAGCLAACLTAACSSAGAAGQAAATLPAVAAAGMVSHGDVFTPGGGCRRLPDRP